MERGTDRHDEANSRFSQFGKLLLKVSQTRRKLDTDVPNTVLDATKDFYPTRLFGRQLFFLCVQKYNSQTARGLYTKRKSYLHMQSNKVH